MTIDINMDLLCRIFLYPIRYRVRFFKHSEAFDESMTSLEYD